MTLRGLALCIGIETYAAPNNSLPGVSEEVKDIAAFWRNVGADVVCVVDCDLTTMRAHVIAMRDRLQAHGDAIDYFLFHFGGHGGDGQIVSADGCNFAMRELQLLISAEHVPNFGTKPRLMFWDCCRGGAVAAPIARGQSEQMSSFSNAAGFFHHYATAEHHVAFCGAQSYSRVLLDVLRTHPDRELLCIATHVNKRLGTMIIDNKAMQQPEIRSTLHASFHVPLRRTTVVFIGNPGVGKSTLLNGLLDDPCFASGTSIGGCLTLATQARVANGTTFIDTPAFADSQMCERAAQEIEAALKLGGVYRIGFVITLEAGRGRPADFVTMKLVVDAVKKPFPFIVVVNKLGKTLMNQRQTLGEVLVQLAAAATGRAPAAVVFVRSQPRLHDAKNTLPMPELAQALSQALNCVQGAELCGTDVQPLEHDQTKWLEWMETRAAALKQEFDSVESEQNGCAFAHCDEAASVWMVADDKVRCGACHNGE